MPTSTTKEPTPKKQTDHSQFVYKSRPALALDNFIGGITWGIGSVIGATIVVAIIGIVLAQSKRLPFIGMIIENIANEIEYQNQER